MLDKVNYPMVTANATTPEVLKVEAKARTVTGKALAHTHKNKTERALVAAAMHLGRVDLQKPTLRQTAALNDVSVTYVVRAIAAIQSGQRQNVESGLVTLTDAGAKARPPALPKPVGLVAALATASDAELAEAGRTVGVTKIWDRMISPNV